MQIPCPKCATSYRIAEEAVGAKGRSVHCVRCDHIWRVEPEAAPAVAAKVKTEEAAFRSELGKPEAEPSPPSAPAYEPPPPETAADQPGRPSLDDPKDSAAPAEPAPEPMPEPAGNPVEQAAPVALADISLPSRTPRRWCLPQATTRSPPSRRKSTTTAKISRPLPPAEPGQRRNGAASSGFPCKSQSPRCWWRAPR